MSDETSGINNEGPILVAVEAKAASVAVGEEIALTVTVTNRGEEGLEVPELGHDLYSVSFLVNFRGKDTLFSHQGEEDYAQTMPDTFSLEAGASRSFRFAFPAIASGDWSIRAGYRFSEEAAVSDPVAVSVDGEGESIVQIQTTQGPMKARFFPEEALNHALHFAIRTRDGLYDDTLFHRVIPDFMIQGGDPEGTGSGGPGYVLPAEFNELEHKPGRLSAARRQDPNSAGCQFFLCHGTPTYLDGQYTVFGEVYEGLDVVDTIATTDTGANDRPVEDQVMTSLTLDTAVVE
ncbi:MAG: peptidylprolyl isomerase [Planctomycetota bacterium]|jgi:peptidyl-prolyl cis-trans isomerase B (cyclophilin B)